MQQSRSYASGRFAMSIDGEFAGFIKKVSGGTIKGEVVAHDIGVSNVRKKHLATISHEPLTLEIGLGMGKSMWEWIKSSFDKGAVRKDAELHALDFNYNAVSNRELLNSYISEVTFPTLDAAAKEPGSLMMTITPETIRYTKGSVAALKTDEAVSSKKWLSSNFRLDLGDLDCRRVSKIDSFKLEQRVVTDDVGVFREPVKEAISLEFPNLKVTFSAASLDTWSDWFQSFVIDGKCTDSDELSGSITFLGPDLNEELFSLSLDNVGIYSLDINGVQDEKVAMAEAELYVERMSLEG